MLLALAPPNKEYVRKILLCVFAAVPEHMGAPGDDRAAGANKMTAVGFEPTQLALVELESTPLDHSGKVSLSWCLVRLFRASTILFASAVARSSVHAECDTQ